MPEKNKAILRRFLEELYLKRNLDIIDEVLVPDFHNIGPDAEHFDRASWKAATQKVFESLGASATDMTTEIQEMIAEGDAVVVVSKSHYMVVKDPEGNPIPPKPIDSSAIVVWKFAGDKIKESIWSFDQLGMLQQLGVIPTELSVTH